jgi:hypothetical protein
MSISTQPEEQDKDKLTALKITVQAAWRTAAVLPDVDARFRKGLAGAWPFLVVREAQESYGYNPPWLKETASPKDIESMTVVMEWMVWLRQRRNGDVDLKRIIAWAIGVPWYIMAARERRSDETIRNRINRSLADILKEFEAIDLNIGIIDEPELSPGRMRGFGEPRGILEGGELPDAGKVYIAGLGFMFRGKKYRSTRDLDERNCGKRRR